MEIHALTALSLGFIYVGSANGDIAGVILQLLMEKEETDLSSKWAKFVVLGLALLYVGRLLEGMSRNILTGNLF